MIILRQHNFSLAGSAGGGILGGLVGRSIGTGVGNLFKRKATNTDLEKEKAAIEENKKFINYLKTKNKLNYVDIGKLQDIEEYGDITDIFENIAGATDDVLYEEDPKYLNYINSKKQQMIQESQNRIREHENNLKNPKNINKGTYKDLGAHIGGTIGVIGGTVLGHRYLKTD